MRPSAAFLGALATLTLIPGGVRAADLIPTQPETPVWRAAAASDVRYFSWQSTRGYPANRGTANGSGAEVYIPYAVELVGRPRDDFKVELTARGGWVWARQSTGGQTGELATSTDSVLSVTTTYSGLAGLQPFASLAFNLPTGRSQLFGPASNARMDPDLVDISTFGEGLNVGPTAGVNIPIGQSMLVTLSAGHTWRGRYDRELGLAAVAPVIQLPTVINPGDVTTVAGMVAFKSGALSMNVTGSISRETITYEDSQPLFRAGLRYLVSANLTYAWPDSFGETALSAAAAHSNRNDVKFLTASSLVREAFNSNSNLYRIGIEHMFPAGKWALGPVGSLLFRDHDGYNSTTLQFVPEKTRWSAGAAARYAASDSLIFNARLERVWTNEDDNPDDAGRKFSVLANGFVPGLAVPVVSSTGWQASLGFTAKF